MHGKNIEQSLEYRVPRTHDMILRGGGVGFIWQGRCCVYDIPTRGAPSYLSSLEWRFADAWSKRTLLVGALWDRNSLDRMYSNIYFTGAGVGNTNEFPDIIMGRCTRG